MYIIRRYASIVCPSSIPVCIVAIGVCWRTMWSHSSSPARRYVSNGSIVLSNGRSKDVQTCLTSSAGSAHGPPGGTDSSSGGCVVGSVSVRVCGAASAGWPRSDNSLDSSNIFISSLHRRSDAFFHSSAHCLPSVSAHLTLYCTTRLPFLAFFSRRSSIARTS